MVHLNTKFKIILQHSNSETIIRYMRVYCRNFQKPFTYQLISTYPPIPIQQPNHKILYNHFVLPKLAAGKAKGRGSIFSLLKFMTLQIVKMTQQKGSFTRMAVVNPIILLMEHANEQLVQIMQSLPLPLDRFWKARILRQHQTEQDFFQTLKICLAEMSGHCSLEVMNILKEKQLLDNYIMVK